MYYKAIMGAFTFVGDKWIICLTAKKFPDAEKDFSPKERSDIMNEVEDLVKKFEGKLSMRVSDRCIAFESIYAFHCAA